MCPSRPYVTTTYGCFFFFVVVGVFGLTAQVPRSLILLKIADGSKRPCCFAAALQAAKGREFAFQESSRVWAAGKSFRGAGWDKQQLSASLRIRDSPDKSRGRSHSQISVVSSTRLFWHPRRARATSEVFVRFTELEIGTSCSLRGRSSRREGCFLSPHDFGSIPQPLPMLNSARARSHLHEDAEQDVISTEPLARATAPQQELRSEDHGRKMEKWDKVLALMELSTSRVLVFQSAPWQRHHNVSY